MQERYLGDVHDYVKFALLRLFIHTLDVRLGINWYLADPCKVDKKGNRDGRKRGYLHKKEWEGLDPDLHRALQSFADPANQSLKEFQRAGILSEDTIFFNEEVPLLNARKDWHCRALSAITKADLVFLDPDTGFQKKTMQNRESPKYVLYDEAADYCRNGKSAVVIQFMPRRDPVEFAEEVRKNLGGRADSVPVVHGRAEKNILFFTLAQPVHVNPMTDALREFAENSPPMKGGRRIDLIH
ncbi:MAG: hypothetical protein MPK06_03695 [Alphaproteobacteria bacterium]|nr:hypothetical protein [Alphaproteobacteria bacterium]MDA8003808.1 hypothetical protein [Alphaproteobacteria bacterium]MDA8005631.1 hypothetical protein [Alphaproteobacteria bacterium]MDA8013349.1 hypothetical protein [Alphaproteobacteria bacterium]